MTSEDVKRHMLHRHGDGVEKPFLCDKCHKTFASKNGLENHITYYHDHVKNHVCHVCLKDFPDKRRLEQHVGAVHGQQVGSESDSFIQ